MTGKERAELRAKANSLEPVFQIGKGGMSDALIKQTEDVLKARELIKIKALLESVPVTPRELADALAEATGAQVIQVIGGCIVLYKENPALREEQKLKEKRKKDALRKARLKATADKKNSTKYYAGGDKRKAGQRSSGRGSGGAAGRVGARQSRQKTTKN